MRLSWTAGLAGLATAVLLLVCSAPRAEAAPQRAPERCTDGADAAVLVSPARPVPGGPLHWLAASETPEATLRIEGPDGRPVAAAPHKRGGPPFSWEVRLNAATAGVYRAVLSHAGGTIACAQVEVRAAASRTASPAHGSFWAAREPWTPAKENLFAAFVEALFDAPAGDAFSFPSLAPLLRDPNRNPLWGHLGLDEDDAKNKKVLPAEPDCADLPYTLRAYFAWKVGLPFGMRDCNRGSAQAPPRCTALLTNEDPTQEKDPLGSYRRFLRKLANTVHSGSARTALNDDATDVYPVPLERRWLRPGTVYADPYGHVLMIVKWVDQAAGHGGLLLAVDGQPDNSIGRKRFWEGTFLFASDVASAGPGFKAFRPLVAAESAAGGAAWRPLRNAELVKSSGFVPFSAEQASLPPDAFYARMGHAINPQGLDPRTAYEETLAALVEQFSTRVGSVDNGEGFMREHPGTVIPMPEGPKIFETVGPWEDFATPSRDMRLLIAMTVVEGMPDQVVRHPQLFVLGGRKPEAVRTELAALHTKRVGEQSIEYRKSNGAAQKLTVGELLARKAAFEMAYNPNDCAEIRWGAPPGSAERATCTRQAPDDQRARMEGDYRPWFHQRRRPTR